MIFEEKQIKKLIDKMTALELPYSKLMFEPVITLEALRYNTKQHLRQVPTGVDWQTIKKGEKWGAPYESMWLKSRFSIPEEYTDRKLVLCSDIGAYECLIFLDGEPSGLFNKDGKILGGNHSIGLITQKAESGRTYDLAIECYSGTPCLGYNPYHNYGKKEVSKDKFIRTYQSLIVCAIREDVAEFLFDLRTLNQLLAALDESSCRRGEVLVALMDAYKEVCQFPVDVDESQWRSQMHLAHRAIKNALSMKNGTSSGKVGLIGHAHMDTAWLWTVEETKRKCARTYSNALSLMDWYPEYTFIQSSALHSAWMRDYYPSIFENMKARIAEGRYEPNGAVWVECDCNITGGESMVRQFLWGQNFTMKEFGYKSDSFWLPDTFGYNSAIPQIMKGVGAKYFLTTKMEWNESNKFPYESFVWKGMDGTSVLVHLNRTNVWPDVKTVIKNYKELPDKHVSPSKLVSYGYGDGGGGPQYQMLEMSRRIKDLNGCPPSLHTTVSQFMQELEEVQEDLPVWCGELYLEVHRGTLTMMHDIKRSNRKAEMILREYEALAVLSEINNNIVDYKNLNGWWSILLKNQFHDILPGTSIPEVHDLAIRENYRLIDEVTKQVKELLSSFAKDDNSVTLFNSLSWTRQGQVTLDIEGHLKNVLTQRIIDIKGNDVLSAKVKILPLGITSYERYETVSERKSLFKYNENTLETPYAIIRFLEDGSIASFVDRSTGRELKRLGGAPLNTFYFSEDVPYTYDNWDIDVDIDMKLLPHMHLLSRKVVSEGPLQIRIENEYKIGQNSKLRQHMICYSDTQRIDFETEIDWKERHCLLKVGFNVNILSSSLKSEMQFGYIDRPTHDNTSWDAAKYEVCNHKWSDLSENRYGIAILNDCKYGISCKDSDIRLTLHKGGCRPDPRGDEGIHYLTYSLLPHKGSFDAEKVVRPSYELNIKPTVICGRTNINESLLSIDVSNVIIESIKPSENGKGYIVRMYECECSAVPSCKITFNRTPAEVLVTDLLEEPLENLEIIDNTVETIFRPFEIKTLLIQ
ncbi:MAG: alpha-mannosidase [Clostridiales bacterium]|nr:alpha-mannosidase [Clostridiales bacterium]